MARSCATTFEGLGIWPELASALSSRGVIEPFEIQVLAIPDGLAGRDVCGKARTGSGKTLAFGLPLLQRCPSGRPGRPRALVLVPTRELAIQVGAVLRSFGEAVQRRVVTVYGGVSMDGQIEALGQGFDIVVATPGRLIDLVERHQLSLGDIELVVVDEADRMADMGFLPQVEWVLRRAVNRRQTMLFSATLDGEVDTLVRRYLTEPVRHEVGSGQPTVDEMEHRFVQVHLLDKVKVASAIIQGADKSLVFVRTKRGADRLARQLRAEGVQAAAIHGDLPQSKREKALAGFASGRLPALVATDVAARGLDIDGVDAVIHYDPPQDYKTYLHRSGRTARAGGSGMAVTLVLWDQLLEVEQVQRRLGLRQPIVEVFSNDPRLLALADWRPGEDAA